MEEGTIHRCIWPSLNRPDDPSPSLAHLPLRTPNCSLLFFASARLYHRYSYHAVSLRYPHNACQARTPPSAQQPCCLPKPRCFPSL